MIFDLTDPDVNSSSGSICKTQQRYDLHIFVRRQLSVIDRDQGQPHGVE